MWTATRYSSAPILGQGKDDLLVRLFSIPLYSSAYAVRSLTTSGYPRLVKRWRRGQPLSAAELVYEGTADDVAVSGYHYFDHGHEYEMVNRGIEFYKGKYFIRQGKKTFFESHRIGADTGLRAR